VKDSNEAIRDIPIDLADTSLAAIASIFLLIRGVAHPTTAILGRVEGTDQFSDKVTQL
jgi:hypothetical protein